MKVRLYPGKAWRRQVDGTVRSDDDRKCIQRERHSLRVFVGGDT
jgi:hypothetical protein